jgi:Tol biopolymer transport system component
VSGRENLQKQEQILYRLDLSDDSTTELARADRLRSATISPSGEWLVYYSTFSTDTAENGLWLLRSDGSERRRLDPELFGAYQWRGCQEECTIENDRLIIVPFDPDATHHEFWELNPSRNIVRPLTDPTLTPFKIANGDWRISPDGRYVAYVENADRNIWVIALPE